MKTVECLNGIVAFVKYEYEFGFEERQRKHTISSVLAAKNERIREREKKKRKGKRKRHQRTQSTLIYFVFTSIKFVRFVICYLLYAQLLATDKIAKR